MGNCKANVLVWMTVHPPPATNTHTTDMYDTAAKAAECVADAACFTFETVRQKSLTSAKSARMYDIFHRQHYTPKIHQIQKLECLGTDLNETKISLCIRTARYREI